MKLIWKNKDGSPSLFQRRLAIIATIPLLPIVLIVQALYAMYDTFVELVFEDRIFHEWLRTKSDD